MSDVVICESRKQVEYFLARRNTLMSDTQLVAANWDAAWVLQKRGASYIALENFDVRQPPDRVEQLLDDQAKWAHRVDALLQESNPQFREMNFRPARYSLYYLKNSWDTLIHRALLLQKLAVQLKLRKVYFFGSPDRLVFERDLTLDVSALAAMIPSWAAHYGIETENLPPMTNDKFWRMQYPWDSRRKSLVEHVLPSYVLQSIRRLYARIKHSPKNGPISNGLGEVTIWHAAHYDLTSAVHEQLRLRGVRLMPLPELRTVSSQAMQRPLDDVWQIARKQDWFWEPGGWQAWRIQDSLEPLFRQFWFDLVPRLWQSTLNVQDAFDHQCPQAIAMAIVPSVEQLGTLITARKRGVPIAFYEHGASMGDVENVVWDVSDRYYSDYMLVYGQGEAQYIQARPQHNDTNATPLVVGSARLDDVRRRGSTDFARTLRERIMGASQRPLVLYIPGVPFNNYFRFDYYDFRIAACFEIRKQIARLFNSHPGVHFVYKAFVSQGNDPTLEMLSELCPNCTIIPDIPLTDLQWAVDVLIHEIPSTGMHEGLLTDKPMIVYVDRDIHRMPPEVKQILAKRAVVAESGDDFIRQIKMLLEQGRYTPISKPDEEFLRTYDTYLNDGESALRAATAIYDIATRTPLHRD